MTLLKKLRALGYEAKRVGKEIHTNAPDRFALAAGVVIVPFGPCDQANMFPRTPAWPGHVPGEAKLLDLRPTPWRELVQRLIPKEIAHIFGGA